MNSSENVFATRNLRDAVFITDPALEDRPVCDLLILIHKHSVQLALKERRSGRMLALEVIHAEVKKFEGWRNFLENISASSKILRNHEFRQVFAGLISTEYTLIPEALYRKDDEIVYFKKNFTESFRYNIHCQKNQQNHLYIAYGTEPELEAELSHLFQDPQIWHHSQALLAGFTGQSSTDKDVWLQVHRETMDIIVSENRKLLLMNSFQWQTNEDVLYYILFVCEQVGVNTEKCTLTITGEIIEGSALYILLYNHFQNVKLPVRPSGVPVSFAKNELPFHEYALMYNFSLCE
jgi:hypothetical protein